MEQSMDKDLAIVTHGSSLYILLMSFHRNQNTVNAELVLPL